MTPHPDSLRVTVLGCGAIGSTVASALSSGTVKNAHLVGVVVRRPDAPEVAPFPVIPIDEALQRSDLIVECAGVDAVRDEGLRDEGLRVIESGVDLLVSSVGALVDESFRKQIMTGGPGRCLVTSGAMGGIDVLGAASRDGGLSTLSLVTTKTPAAVVQPWMSDTQREEVLAAAGPTTVFSGNVREAIRLFPRSLNVAVALALATDLWDELTVTMIADKGATLTAHAVNASGTSGDYEFTMRHRPHPQNPATSSIVPAALLQDIENLAQQPRYHSG